MAALQIGEGLELDDPKRVSIDLLVQNGLTKGVIKRVVADNADDEWRIRRGKCVGWPLDKFSEVINKSGFELKFRRGGLLRPGRRAIEEGRQQKEQMENRKSKMANGYSLRLRGDVNGPPLPSPLLQLRKRSEFRRRGRRYRRLGRRVMPLAAPGAKGFNRRGQGELCQNRQVILP